jgi:hypothetical protein
MAWDLADLGTYAVVGPIVIVWLTWRLLKSHFELNSRAWALTSVAWLSVILGATESALRFAGTDEYVLLYAASRVGGTVALIWIFALAIPAARSSSPRPFFLKRSPNAHEPSRKQS